jgi:hypothetical protein
MSHLNTNFDNVDMDSFLNLPQDEFTPVSSTPNTQTSQLSSQTSRFSSGNQTFSGPSFQYDAYRQQTGIPVGGLANTFAVNQTAGLQHWDGQGSFVLPSGHIDLQGLSKDDDFDFNDFDLEAESPIYGGSQGQFVSPTTLVASSAGSSGPIQRIYPGMHSQAAQAKAEQAKQQQEMLRRQQQQQPQRPLPAGQKPLPKGGPAKDPQVEESISRILNQMRQKSTSSDTKEEDSPITNLSGLPRSRKDDEDMDEDERLLASEEGKKLSSKERRQLRNKVSARAFRSRRKGKQNRCIQLSVSNMSQSTLANLRVKSSRRLMRTLCFAPKISSFVRRTIASLTSLACCCHPRRSPASCKNSASLEDHFLNRLVHSQLQSVCKRSPNHKLSAKMSARTTLHVRCRNTLKSAWQ